MATLYKFKHVGTFMGNDAYTDDFEIDSLGPRVWRRMANGIDVTLNGTDVAAAAEILRLAEENERLRAVATPLLLLFAERLAVWERMNSVEACAAFGGDPYPFPEEVTLACSFPVTVLRGLAHVTPPAQEGEEPPGTSSPAPRD